MKTNRIIDGIRKDISSECKEQAELSVAIANRIYEILEIKGMNQKDLAQRLGKTETEVSRWLSGTHNLTLSTICKISTALGEELSLYPKVKNKPKSANRGIFLRFFEYLCNPICRKKRRYCSFTDSMPAASACLLWH